MPTAFGLLPPETQDTTAGRASDITSPQAQNFTPTEANLTPPSQAQPTLNPELDETQIKIAKLLADNQREIDQNTPPDRSARPGVMGVLSNFFSGGQQALSVHLGLPTMDQKRTAAEERQQRLLEFGQRYAANKQLMAHAGQQAWQQQYQFPQTLAHNALLNQSEQLGIQKSQFEFEQEKANVPTMRLPLDADTAKYAQVPASYVGKVLNEGDQRVIDSRLAARGFERFDTGKDGTGVGKGIWIMDRFGNPVKQIGTVSETGRATAIAKMQLAAAQNYVPTPAGSGYDQQIASLGAKGGIVKGILEGRQAMPSAFALKTPYWQGIMQAVYQIDPQFSEQRAQLRKGYTVGKQSTEINAINTTMGHIGVLGDAIDALNNNDLPALNRAANFLGVQTGQTPVTTYRTIVNRVAPELTRAYVGTVAGEAERRQAAADFDPNLAPEQLKQNIGKTAQLLRSKISSLENQWDQNRAQGMKAFQDQFLMPEAQRQLNKWSPQAGTSQGGQGQPSGMGGGDFFSQFGGKPR